jgi:hypothetical protein
VDPSAGEVILVIPAALQFVQEEHIESPEPSGHHDQEIAEVDQQLKPPRGPNPTIRLAGETALFHIINVVHLIGYLGKNPEHKSVKASDRKYAVLSMATQRSWKGANEEWHSKTEWHRVVVIWNPACTSI